MNRKAHIIESLKILETDFRDQETYEGYVRIITRTCEVMTLQTFCIFPATFLCVFEEELSFSSMYGLIFYRKNNHLLAIQVDKTKILLNRPPLFPILCDTS